MLFLTSNLKSQTVSRGDHPWYPSRHLQKQNPLGVCPGCIGLRDFIGGEESTCSYHVHHRSKISIDIFIPEKVVQIQWSKIGKSYFLATRLVKCWRPQIYESSLRIPMLHHLQRDPKSYQAILGWARLGTAGLMVAASFAARCSQRKPSMSSCLWSVLKSVPSGVQQRPGPADTETTKGMSCFTEGKGLKFIECRCRFESGVKLMQRLWFCTYFGKISTDFHPEAEPAAAIDVALQASGAGPKGPKGPRTNEKIEKQMDDADDIGRFCEPSHFEVAQVWFAPISTNCC